MPDSYWSNGTIKDFKILISSGTGKGALDLQTERTDSEQLALRAEGCSSGCVAMLIYSSWGPTPLVPSAEKKLELAITAYS